MEYKTQNLGVCLPFLITSEKLPLASSPFSAEDNRVSPNPNSAFSVVRKRNIKHWVSLLEWFHVTILAFRTFSLERNWQLLAFINYLSLPFSTLQIFCLLLVVCSVLSPPYFLPFTSGILKKEKQAITPPSINLFQNSMGISFPPVKVESDS